MKEMQLQIHIFLAQQYQALVSMKTSGTHSLMVEMKIGTAFEIIVSFLIKLNIHISYDPAICVLYPDRMKNYIHTKFAHKSL